MDQSYVSPILSADVERIRTHEFFRQVFALQRVWPSSLVARDSSLSRTYYDGSAARVRIEMAQAAMNFDLEVKVAVYQHFAETGVRPSCDQVAERVGTPAGAVAEAYERLRAQRVLVLESDGVSIRMAPPFSGVATQHVVKAGSRSYFANCAWDAFGIPAALQQPATVHSRCEQSMEPLRLEVGLEGPASSDWVFHCVVPAAHWWDDIVFT